MNIATPDPNPRGAPTLTRRQFLQQTGALALCTGLGRFFAASVSRAAESHATPSSTASPPTFPFKPAYLALHEQGILRLRADTLWDSLAHCQLCPRQCGVNRLLGKQGFCRAPGADLIVSSALPHFGEERPLVGKGGSGTIFFSHCNLRCVFCQNWEISHLGRGTRRSISELADLMLSLQTRGCHNINLVTPTHYLPHILKALDLGVSRGLQLPIVYNTCGWEKIDLLKQLEGIVDIYLPDFKYGDGETAAKYSAGARSYPEITKAALLEMNRQVGIAQPHADGLIRRGLIIRHLIMPNLINDSIAIVEWIAAQLPLDTYLNLMSQYHPAYKAFDYPELSRRLTLKEYEKVVARARELGLRNLDLDRRWLTL